MSTIDDGISVNPSSNETFAQVVEKRLSRRSMLKGSGGAALFTAAGASGVATLVSACAPPPPGGGGPGTGGPGLLGFTGIPVNSDDTVTVPPGYTAEVLISWGDPVSNGPAWAPDASATAADQAQQWGMHNDGIVYFPINGSRRGLICQNNEYTDEVLLFTDGTAGYNAAKTAKSQAAHGVAIIEVQRVGNTWSVKRPSAFARRITANTPMTFTGPAAGHSLLQTAADPTGTAVLGTFNNCAMGFTPWGTYLTCEENFNGYFRKNTAVTPANALEARYGIGSSATVAWWQHDTRFDVDQTPNEPNRHGWVVEIDPFDPGSVPAKRTALGRMKHEGAWIEEADDGRIVCYLGDDQVNEYIYRYVSSGPWQEMMDNGVHPLDDGILYVAKFNADGSGEWLPLTTSNPLLAGFASIGDILINARAAADAAGGTKMDRPEWIDVLKPKKEVYVTLTNNSGRGGAAPNPGVDAANPRANNIYGHIVKWGYPNDFTDNVLYWEIFALGGDPANPAHGSTIVGDKYGSPDGLYFAPSGRMWIQTDVSGSTIGTGNYAGFGNNQMLCADPETRETRRFLVGPKQCEITGVFATPDEKTLFVGIQHPGEAPSGSLNPANPTQHSSWPDGIGRPRSSLLAITKDDGGVIGS